MARISSVLLVSMVLDRMSPGVRLEACPYSLGAVDIRPARPHEPFVQAAPGAIAQGRLPTLQAKPACRGIPTLKEGGVGFAAGFFVEEQMVP